MEGVLSQETKLFLLYNKPLLTKLFQSQWLDIGPNFFCLICMTSALSWCIKTQKQKKLANIQPDLVNKHMYGVDNSTKFFRLYFFWQISIFMTHLSNYGNDRIALLVFDSLVKHLQCWTNIKLSSEHPVELAERYFTMFPGEMEPIWQVFHLNAV